MVKLTISASRIKTLLIYSVAVLVVLNFIGMTLNHFFDHDYVYGFVPMFNLDTENNIPTWFSSLLLLTASCLLYVIAAALKKRRGVYAKYWLSLSVVFLYLSVDESASIHELLTLPLRGALGLSGVLHFSWVLVGFALVVAISVVYLRFILELPRSTRISFVLAAGVYVGGALGVELLGGPYESPGYVYGLITTAEEVLEMAGVVIFINALIEFLRLNKIGVQFAICE